MKHKFFGIYGRMFFYTALILIIIVIIMFVFFSSLIKSAVTATQQKQMAEIFHPLLMQLNGKTEDEIIAFAKEFHEKNSYFDFCFQDHNGRVLYRTEGFTMSDDVTVTSPNNFTIREKSRINERFNFSVSRDGNGKSMFISLASGGMKLYVIGPMFGSSIYKEFLEKIFLAFTLILISSLTAAAVFAKQIAKPIKKIAEDTKKMSRLENVDVPQPRKDEIGQLAGDVYGMYSHLKSTIGQLETEVKRVKEMEQNQRYFFSAASHELKTPIAATGAILEGMLQGLIPPEKYENYLNECMKLMNEQNKLVSEILEIAKLHSDVTKMKIERLNLADRVNEVLVPCFPIIEAKNQNIETMICERIFVKLDSMMLGKVISNLVLNGTQNLPLGAKIRIFTESEENHVLFNILNEDAKIPDEILERVFQPFFRIDEARTTGWGGSGLGLSIVKKTLDLMGIPFFLKNTESGVLFQMELTKYVSYI